jgi:L-cysteine S-thiosulfotransferase
MKTHRPIIVTALAGAALLTTIAVGCMSTAGSGPTDDEVALLLKQSFGERGQARLDRLDQSPLQRACSNYSHGDLPNELRARFEQAALAGVKYPEDGRWLGEWAEGEKIAQNGRGMQYTDAAGSVAGGNCYACHRLSKQELSFGNIGPSLYNYGKLRGNSEETMKYTWAKIWNSNAFNACSQMPRYGDAGVLTEAQIRNLMALLFDPASPVNR